MQFQFALKFCIGQGNLVIWSILIVKDKRWRVCVTHRADLLLLTCTASINSDHSSPAGTLFTFCTLPRVMTVPTASACVLWKQARILWKIMQRTDGHFLIEYVADSQFAWTKTEHQTRSVTFEPSGNDSASYYAFVLAIQVTAASLLASACYDCLVVEPRAWAGTVTLPGFTVLTRNRFIVAVHQVVFTVYVLPEAGVVQ